MPYTMNPFASMAVLGMTGSPGSVAIPPIHPSAFTYEHIPAAVAYDPRMLLHEELPRE